MWLNPFKYSLEALQKAQAIAVIISSTVVAILVAAFGFWIQKTIASESLRKDYVQMAVQILNRPGVKEGEKSALDKWASEVVRRNSPFPMPDEAGLLMARSGFSGKFPRLISGALGYVGANKEPFFFPSDNSPAIAVPKFKTGNLAEIKRPDGVVSVVYFPDDGSFVGPIGEIQEGLLTQSQTSSGELQWLFVPKDRQVVRITQ